MVDQGSEFYNSSFQKCLEDNIRTLKNKIFKHATAVSKYIYFDVLNDILNKYNNTYHRTIKMKPTDVKPDSYAEYNVNSNDKDPKFKVADYVRILNYKNFVPFLLLAKLKIQFHGLMLLVI